MVLLFQRKYGKEKIVLKKLKKLGISFLTSLMVVTGIGQGLIKADQTLPQLDLQMYLYKRGIVIL